MVWVKLSKKIVQFILDNGKMILNKEMEFKQMKKETDMKDNSKTILDKDLVSKNLLMVINIQASGKMDLSKEKEHIIRL